MRRRRTATGGFVTRGSPSSQPDTWPVATPAHVQKLIRTGAFDAMATAGIRAAVDALPAARRWRPPPTWAARW
jgi:hypothetical protein